MQLRFSLPAAWSLDVVRALFEVMAQALFERPVSLACVRRQAETDDNGQHACFTAEWADGPVTFTESVRSGAGNPRDGYGYDIDLTLTLPALVVKARSGGWEPTVTQLTLELPSAPRAWLTLREVLRRELGVEHDQSVDSHLFTEVITGLTNEGDVATALSLAKECLAKTTRAAYGREKLIAWLAKHDPGAGGAQLLVTEAPAALDGWLELERGGTPLAEAFARLCPFDSTRWSAAGLPAAPWSAHPLWPLARVAAPEGEWRTVHLAAHSVGQALADSVSSRLTGWKWGPDWQDVNGEVLQGSDWRTTIRRRARAPREGALPVVHVTLECERREPSDWALPWRELLARPVQERLRWSFIGGEATGDVLLIVERSLPQGTTTPTPAAVAFVVVGSDEFLSRAQRELAELTRLRWHPTSAVASLEPWKVETPPLMTALAALEAVHLPEEELARARVLLGCRCVQPQTGRCEHRGELEERWRREALGSPAAVARGAAWAAALAATGARPDHEAERKCARMVSEQLTLAAEFIT